MAIPWNTSRGSKPVTTIGTRYRAAIGSYSAVPITAQTCPAARNPWTRFWGEERIASMAGGTRTCETRTEKLVRPLALGLDDRHRIGRRGGFESDGEEDDLLVGMLAGDLQAVRWRIHDPHVAAARLDGEEVKRGPGDPQHVPE